MFARTSRNPLLGEKKDKEHFQRDFILLMEKLKIGNGSAVLWLS